MSTLVIIIDEPMDLSCLPKVRCGIVDIDFSTIKDAAGTDDDVAEEFYELFKLDENDECYHDRASDMIKGSLVNMLNLKNQYSLYQDTIILYETEYGMLVLK